MIKSGKIPAKRDLDDRHMIDFGDRLELHAEIKTFGQMGMVDPCDYTKSLAESLRVVKEDYYEKFDSIHVQKSKFAVETATTTLEAQAKTLKTLGTLLLSENGVRDS
jgi:hypothetical protein